MTILFPTDFSDIAENAFRFACNLAIEIDASITLLHIYEIPVADANMGLDVMKSIEEEQHGKSISTMQSITEKFIVKEGNEDFADLSFNFVAAHGFVVDEVVKAAGEECAELIVMGTAGASGIKEIFGSNTKAIVERSGIPVLAVPANVVYRDIKRIVYASDLKRSDLKALTGIKGWAEIFDAHIKVIHIGAEKADEWQGFVSSIQDSEIWSTLSPFTSFQLIPGADAEEALKQYLRQEQVDLLAFTITEKNFLQRWFGQSFSKKMAHHVEIPFLAFKISAE